MAAYSVSAVSCAALSFALLGCPATHSPRVVTGDHVLGVTGHGEVVCRTELVGLFGTPRWTVMVRDADTSGAAEVLVVNASWLGGPGYPKWVNGYVTDEGENYSLHLESLRMVSNRYPMQVLLR